MNRQRQRASGRCSFLVSATRGSLLWRFLFLVHVAGISIRTPTRNRPVQKCGPACRLDDTESRGDAIPAIRRLVTPLQDVFIKPGCGRMIGNSRVETSA